jgi:hypothetical protein
VLDTDGILERKEKITEKKERGREREGEILSEKRGMSVKKWKD